MFDLISWTWSTPSLDSTNIFGLKYVSLTKGYSSGCGRQGLRRVVLTLQCFDVGGDCGELSVQSLVFSVALILRGIVVTLDSGSGQWTLWGVKPNLIWGN